jgi:hypothetical protein
MNEKMKEKLKRTFTLTISEVLKLYLLVPTTESIENDIAAIPSFEYDFADYAEELLQCGEMITILQKYNCYEEVAALVTGLWTPSFQPSPRNFDGFLVQYNRPLFYLKNATPNTDQKQKYSLLFDVKNYRTFFDVVWQKRQIVKDEQLRNAIESNNRLFIFYNSMFFALATFALYSMWMQ